MTVTIKIELGNDAMQTPSDVAEALQRLAIRIDEIFCADLFEEGNNLRIYDSNGNTVGRLDVGK